MKLYLILFFLYVSIFVDIRNGRRLRRSWRKRGYDAGHASSHRTRSCSTSSSKCTCENRPYEVKIGNDELGFNDDYSGPIESGTIGGDKVYCYHYTVARVRNRVDRCSDTTLNAIIIGLDPEVSKCQISSCNGYKNMIVSQSCSCSCRKCCKTSIAKGPMNIYGAKYKFLTAIDTDYQEQELSLCILKVDEVSPAGGLIAYYSTPTSGFTCDSYDIPNFCEGM